VCAMHTVALLTGVPEQCMHTCCGLTSVVNLCLLQGAVLISPTTALIQVFNVSHNNLTGSVPSFLASSKVPSYTKQGVSLVVRLFVFLQLATLPSMWFIGSNRSDYQPPPPALAQWWCWLQCLLVRLRSVSFRVYDMH